MSNGLLYIFDKDEKLLSILNNEASESNVFFDDEFKKELNGEWSYKFSVDMSKTKDIMLEYNKVGFYDSKGNFQLFIIHDIEDNISYDAIRTLYCLHDFQTLNEEILEVGKITGTAGEALQLALKGTKYSVGKVSTTEEQIKDLSMITSLEAVYSIAETYGLELYFRLELDETKTKISKRYVDLVSRLGVDSGLTFDFSLNIESIKRKINNNFFTALYGRGKKLKDDTYANFSEATWVKGENPANKPQGQLWVADEEAVKKYGLRKGIYSNQNISIANTLLSRTWEKLQKVNRPKVNYEASVYDLSSIAGYENLQVSLGDRFDILDKEYNINESVRVIAEYESILDDTKKKIELGDPIAGIVEDAENGNDGTVEDTEEDSDTPQEPDAPGEGENTLPKIPVVSAEGYFATISISWTFENKNYYTYELYASDVKGFTPNENNKIFEGKASAFLHEVEPMGKWYYKVRAKNDYDRYTEFSTEVSAETLKIADGSKYFESASIKDALIGNLKLDRGWVGELKGNYINAKNLSVTDGNGKRTLDIDSFGNVNLDVTSLKIKSSNVPTSNQVISPGNAIADINVTPGNVKISANKIDLNGAVTAGSYSQGHYVKINQENYNVYRENVNTMTMGTLSHEGKIVPVIWQGADGHSGGRNYGGILHQGNRLLLTHYNADRLDWSELSFYDNGIMELNPANILKLSSGMGIELNSHIVPYAKDTIFIGKVDNPFSDVQSKNFGLSFDGVNHGNIYGRDGRVTIEAKEGHDIYLSTAWDAIRIDADNGHLTPTKYNRQSLGCESADYRWTKVCLLSNPDVSSDLCFKENIKYLGNSEGINTIDDNTITVNDMYEFIKNDLKLAEYNYKGFKKSTIGFVAQDIENSKVGKKLIHKNDDNKLSYDTGTRISIIEGALKKAIEKIEELEKEIDILKAKN